MEHLSSTTDFSGVRVARALVFCRSLFVVLAIVLSVRVQFTDSEYPFSILKVFLQENEMQNSSKTYFENRRNRGTIDIINIYTWPLTILACYLHFNNKNGGAKLDLWAHFF